MNQALLLCLAKKWVASENRTITPFLQRKAFSKEHVNLMAQYWMPFVYFLRLPKRKAGREI
jgi:hypothetical protein